MNLWNWPKPLIALVDWLRRAWERANYRRLVDCIRDFFHILWICRVATVSVIVGFLVISTPQAVDLFREVAGFLGSSTIENLGKNLWFAALFGSALLLWAIPLHGAARWSLDSLANPPRTLLGRKFNDVIKPRSDLNPWLIEYVPRALGFACFVSVGIGIYRAYVGSFDVGIIRMASIAQEQLLYLFVSVLASAALYVVYVIWRFEIFNLTARPVRLAVTVTRRERVRTVEGPGVVLIRIVAVVAVVGVTFLLLWYIFSPKVMPLELRALLVPIVLGAWVPALSVLTWLSYPARVPIFTLMIAAIVIYRMFAGEARDVRTLQSDTISAPAPLEMTDAVQQWMDKNACANIPENCPPPIVVAAAGGASRAAYVTGSTLGYFMDLTCPPDAVSGAPSVPCGSTDIPAFADRVFAISGVSGGALGAAVFSALLKAQQERAVRDSAPCRRLPSDGTFWFRPGIVLGWRDCAQLILSEDFLSPPVLGLAFRDQIPFFRKLDRAGLFENALTRAFDKYVSQTTRLAGLGAPFESFAPDKAHWRPLLVFNGTSVATGRRILTSHIAIEKAPDDNSGEGKPLFDDAYDFFRLIGLGRVSKSERGTGEMPVTTISLATAVTNSGRFPILTPPGVLRDQSNGTVRDRIVDGGYFEDYGITTVNEIARELRNRGLKPRILLITNDPTSVQRVQQFDDRRITPTLPESREGALFSPIFAPLQALYGTRISRGDLAVIRASQDFSANTTSHDQFPIAHVTVYGVPAHDTKTRRDGSGNHSKFTEVSMSLWLSKPVQEYLDRQLLKESLSSGKQQEMLRRVCDWLDHPNERERRLKFRCGEGVKAFIDEG